MLPDISKPFEIATDASNYAIGGVLFQRDENQQERPVAYASRVLSKTEQRYSTTEREMLAIYHWVRYWRNYVWGTSFKVHTDHSPLRGIKTKKDVTRRLTRMILNLQEYDFELFYVPGKRNGVPDGCSRNPIADYKEQCNTMCENDEELIESLTTTEWLMCQLMEEPLQKELLRK